MIGFTMCDTERDKDRDRDRDGDRISDQDRYVEIAIETGTGSLVAGDKLSFL